jgi:hypothetical protein
MADPREEEKSEKIVTENVVPLPDDEISEEEEAEKISGGGILHNTIM